MYVDQQLWWFSGLLDMALHAMILKKSLEDKTKNQENRKKVKTNPQKVKQKSQ